MAEKRPDDVPTRVDGPERADHAATIAVESPAGVAAPALASPYEDEGPLGAGGMGEVRVCRDVRLDRSVAMKTLLPAHAMSGEMLARFLREARVQGSLEHPAIVPVYDVGVRDGIPFFTMKRVGGATLRDILELPDHARVGAQHSRRKLLSALSHLCQAVHYAHLKGILHRDLKPANIMFGDFGEVYVLDWGIAQPGPRGTDTGAAESGLTAVGVVTGTLGYMPPEQLRAEPLDPRADVYALGAILYEIIAFAPLHDRSTAEACRRSTLDGPDVAARLAADVEPELVATCARAVALERDDRFPSAQALHEALERFLDGDRDLERRRALSRDIAHTAAAAATLAHGDEPDAIESRKRALKEVGRALALDPDNTTAVGILVDLLRQGPRVLPADAVERVERARMRLMAESIPWGAWTTLALPSFLPLVLMMGVHSWSAIVTMMVAWALAMGSLVAAGTLWRGNKRGLLLAEICCFAFASSLSTLLGPFVLVPMSAMISTFIFAFHFGRRSAFLGLLAVATPVLLGLVGVLPSSYQFVGGALLIQPGAVELPPGTTLVLLGGAAASGVIIAALFAARLRSKCYALIERTELHAWHLEQMTSPPKLS